MHMPLIVLPLIAGIENGLKKTVERVFCAHGNNHLVGGAGNSGYPGCLLGNRGPQLGGTRHRRVPRRALVKRLLGGLEDMGRRIEIGLSS